MFKSPSSINHSKDDKRCLQTHNWSDFHVEKTIREGISSWWIFKWWKSMVTFGSTATECLVLTSEGARIWEILLIDEDNKKVLSIRFKFHNWFQFHEVGAYSHLINDIIVHSLPLVHSLQPLSSFPGSDALLAVFLVGFPYRFDLRSFFPCLLGSIQLNPTDEVRNCYRFLLLTTSISLKLYDLPIMKSFHSKLLIFLLISFSFVMNVLN